MKRTITLAGLLSIGFCIVLSSCGSGKKSMNSLSPEVRMPGKLKSLISDSLMCFNEDASGKICVSVQGKMLFKPGSASIDLKGQKALRPLGEMLYTCDDFTMMVKGITDTVEVKREKYLSYWTLSEARAASIMSILITTMRDKDEEREAAELKALKKAFKARNETESGQDIPQRAPVTPQQRTDTTKYVVILVNSL